MSKCRRAIGLVILAALILLTSCEIEEAVAIKSDGSGTYVARITIEKQFAAALPELKTKALQQGFRVTEEAGTAEGSVIVLAKDFQDVSQLSDDNDRYSLAKSEGDGFRHAYSLTISCRTNASANGWQKRVMRISMPVKINTASSGSVSGRHVEWDCSSGGTLVVDAAGILFPFGLTPVTGGVLTAVILLMVVMGIRTRRPARYRCTACGVPQAADVAFCTACGARASHERAAPPPRRVWKLVVISAVALGLVFLLIAMNVSLFRRAFSPPASQETTATPPVARASGTAIPTPVGIGAATRPVVSEPGMAAATSDTAAAATDTSSTEASDHHTIMMLHLDEVAGEYLNDSGGRGYDATTTSAVVPGRVGNGRRLSNDVSNVARQFITLGNASAFNPTQALTFDAWIYPTSGPEGLTNGIPIISREDSWMGNIAYILELGTRPCALHLYDGDVSLCADVIVPVNSWSHVAFTLEGHRGTKTARLYLNGVAAGEQTVSGSLKTNALTTYVGRRWGSQGGSQYNRGFDGIIDEIRLADVARSPQEIAAVAAEHPLH
ncbi:MAG: hypothetical protein QOK37_371 [Thermoanaerobaculia bacterium]|jgi:hypothetical protein|nr:hypothetical protein [Thermoanaerobaculia bacterium]